MSHEINWPRKNESHFGHPRSAVCPSSKRFSISTSSIPVLVLFPKRIFGSLAILPLVGPRVHPFLPGMESLPTESDHRPLITPICLFVGRYFVPSSKRKLLLSGRGWQSFEESISSNRVCILVRFPRNSHLSRKDETNGVCASVL